MRTQWGPEYRTQVTRTFLRTAHTFELTPAELRAARSLLDAAFDGDFSDHDWDHGLGGVHVLVQDGAGDLIAHGSVVQRRVLHNGRSLRTGYAEAVGVRPDLQRRGIGGQVMGALERIVTGAYEIGALSASAEGRGLYEARGWWEWTGAVGTYGPDGVVALPEEDPPLLWGAPAVPFDPAHPLLIEWRDGDVF